MHKPLPAPLWILTCFLLLNGFWVMGQKGEGVLIRSLYPDTAHLNQLIGKSYNLKMAAPEEAITIAKDVLKQSQYIQYADGIAQSLNAIGLAYETLGDYKQSLHYYNLGIAFCERYHSPYILYHYVNYARVLLDMGDYEEAAVYFMRSIEIMEQNKWRHKVQYDYTTPYQGLHIIWLILRNVTKSNYYLNKAIALAEAKGDSCRLAGLYIAKASTFENLPVNDSKRKITADSILHYGLKALSISTCRDQTNEMHALRSITQYYILRQQYDSARHYLSRFKAVLNSVHLNKKDRINALGLYGDLNRRLNNNRYAEKILKMCLDSACYYSLPELILFSQQELSLLYADRRDFDRAFYYQMEAAKSKGKLKEDEKSKKIMVWEARFEQAQKQKQLALQQLESEGLKRKILIRTLILSTTSLAVLGCLIAYLIYRKNEKRKADFKTEQLKTRIKELENKNLLALVNTEEQERKRIAMELHDGVGSMLAVSRLNLNFVKRKYDVKDDEFFRETLRLLDETAENIRNTSHMLLPDMLLKGGLEEALRVYCAQIRKIPSLEFQAYGNALRLEPEREKAIFRIVQQLLDMVYDSVPEHNCLLQLNWHDQELYLVLELYDAEFWPQNFLLPAWANFRQMVLLFKGQIETDYSSPGDSTISLEFPYNPNRI